MSALVVALVRREVDRSDRRRDDSGALLLGWLAGGVLVGVLAALAATGDVRGRVLPALGAATLAGVGTGLAYLLWAALSRGALGDLRLVGLGPRLPDSLLVSLPLIILSAALAGLVAGVVRSRPAGS